MSISNDERQIQSITFNTNLSLFWLKTDFVLTSKRIMGYSPNEFLGFIPLGGEEISFPLKNIAGVRLFSEFRLTRFILAIILFILALKLLPISKIGSIMITLIGMINLFNCYILNFGLTNAGGESTWIEVSLLEKTKMQNFVDVINNMVATL